MTGINDPELIVVQVAPDDYNLKIVWTIGGVEYDPYSIAMSGLLETSKQIRVRLQQLVDHVAKKETTAAANKLTDLTRLGYNLYLDLFAATRNGSIANDVKQILARPTPYLIMFKVKDYLHVPWGMIYDVEPGSRSGDAALSTDIVNYRDFWCLKYGVSAINKMITPREILPIPESYFRILSVINKSAFLKAVRSLEKEERTMLRSITALEFRDPIFKRAEFFDRWRNIANEVNFLYFYGHANETTLALDDEEAPITVGELNRRLLRNMFDLEQSGCMVFMNGCLTAVGTETAGFLQATGREGFCGFIGTEAKIPDLFALRFGMEFLQAFLRDGRKVHEIMSTLRAKYWPLSLVYSTCCYPLKYVERPGALPQESSPGEHQEQPNF